MIQSKYILDILDLTFDGLDFEDSLRKQIPFLSEKHEEHTGIGLIIDFLVEPGIELYRSSADKAQNLDTQGNRTEMLNGVEIKNEELKVLADATVHLTNGIIDCVEILNKNGEMYPLKELQEYELTQLWLDITQRRSIKKRKL
ncbi:hypothetical protein ACFSQD_19565 [Flavihumibacter stibioxidans]|uniref:Uncharacterized protein n=1 Tax=Flavihumibacter stibioxidans TaxID=1834163 RepID=A0ABR7M955_9BACT|nr:hypothetical protein [Flavihumibacter stibioxidans]MBC6491547.1 hypothetical protein [Flavihumibacter stibioxidans]